MIFPIGFSAPVSPLDKPTVAIADVISYKVSRKSPCETARSAIVSRNSVDKLNTAIATHLLIVSSDTFRFNTTTSFFPLILANIEAKSRTTVTVLMPPAVPAGEPPINIRIKYAMQDAGRKYSCEIVAKPAVRSVTD